MLSLHQLIAEYQPITYLETDTSSAVLIILIQDHEIIEDILLLKRPENLSSYAGDMCFPGGIKEAVDLDLKYTALRETREEIGLMLDESCVIGQLDDFKDRKNRLVRPYVATIEKNQLNSLKVSECEVEMIALIPLAAIKDSRLDVDNVKLSARKPSYFFEINDFFIWGLTASILVHFSNVLYGTDKSVGHSCL